MLAGSVLQSLFGLALVLGLIFGLSFVLRRVQRLRPKAAGALSLHGGLQVGPRERVMWVQAGDKHLLIGVAPGRVNTLHVFDQAPEFPVTSEAQSVSVPSFKVLLKRSLGRDAS